VEVGAGVGGWVGAHLVVLLDDLAEALLVYPGWRVGVSVRWVRESYTAADAQTRTRSGPAAQLPSHLTAQPPNRPTTHVR
jgi:hypothetical protein